MSDTTDDITTNRRAYLKATGAVGLAGAIGLAGCTGTADAATGTLATAVKDAPGDIEDFESCVITIEGIWIKSGGDGTDDGTDEPETGDNETDAGDPEMTAGMETNETEMPVADDLAAQDDEENGTEQDEDEVTEQDEDDVDEGDGRTYYEFEEAQEADLVQLQDGNTQLVDDREIPVGSYQYLQLDVSNVDGTLVEGGEAEVDTPGNAPLQFKHAFEVREGQRTVFTADFTPVKRGRTNRYLFQPVAKGTSVSYEDAQTETESGTATENGTETATTSS